MCNKILLQVAVIVNMSPTLSMPTKYKICVYMYDNYVIIPLFYINMQNYNINIQGNHVPMQLIYECLHSKLKKKSMTSSLVLKR